jgi:hypothetical protein
MDEKAKATEWQRRRNLPGVQVRYMNTKRASDTVLSLLGRELGTKTTIYKRGKVSQVSFHLPEIDM